MPLFVNDDSTIGLRWSIHVILIACYRTMVILVVIMSGEVSLLGYSREGELELDGNVV